MSRWLLRREAILNFECRVSWLTGNMGVVSLRGSRNYRSRCHLPGLSLAKTPSVRHLPLSELGPRYGANHFYAAMQTFVAQYREGRPRYTARRRDQDIRLSFDSVDIWHLVKFDLPDVQLGTRMTHEIVYAYGDVTRKSGRHVKGRFDTVFINDTGAEAVGIQGKP